MEKIFPQTMDCSGASSICRHLKQIYSAFIFSHLLILAKSMVSWYIVKKIIGEKGQKIFCHYHIGKDGTLTQLPQLGGCDFSKLLKLIGPVLNCTTTF